MTKFYKNFPYYDDDSDFNTNSTSYYKDLGRKTKLIKLLAKRIWEYDERLDKRLDDLENVLQDYLSQWDERIENLDDEVSHIFVTWLEDGTLEQIINHDVLGNKADKTFVDSEIERLEQTDENLTTQLAQTSSLVGVNPESFGGVGDGVTDDTEALRLANVLHDVIQLPKGSHYRLQNFVPRKGTTLIFEGAKITRFSNEEYENTGSSASVIIKNEDVTIRGGLFTDDLVEQEVFTGSILIEAGSAVIDGSIIENSWGGIFGHQDNVKNRKAENVSIINTEIRECQHNTYLADIENLTIEACRIHSSRRDGIRTYRAVENIIISDNHIFNNGDGEVGQSQDGIDLFIAGKRAIITGNFIHNNFSRGIDIKRNADGSLEKILDEEYIITNNFIFENLSGINIEAQADTWGYIENVTIALNHIFDNESYGIRTKFADKINHSENHVYNNGGVGIRVEQTQSGGIISSNICYGNSSVSILVLNTANNVDCVNNNIHNENDTQANGLSYSSDGICKDNNVRGHAINITGTPSIEAKGSKMQAQIRPSDGNVVLMNNNEGVLNNLELLFDNVGTFEIEISKRSADGTFDELIYSGSLTVDTSYKKYRLPITSSSRILNENQTIFIKLTYESSNITNAMVQFNYIN